MCLWMRSFEGLKKREFGKAYCKKLHTFFGIASTACRYTKRIALAFQGRPPITPLKPPADAGVAQSAIIFDYRLACAKKRPKLHSMQSEPCCAIYQVILLDRSRYRNPPLSSGANIFVWIFREWILQIRIVSLCHPGTSTHSPLPWLTEISRLLCDEHH